MLHYILGFVLYAVITLIVSFVWSYFNPHRNIDGEQILLFALWPIFLTLGPPVGLIVGIIIIFGKGVGYITDYAQAKGIDRINAKRAKERMKQDIEDRAFFEGDEEPTVRAEGGVRFTHVPRNTLDATFVGNTWD